MKLESLGGEKPPKNPVMSQIGNNGKYMNRIKERAIAELQMSLINPDGVVSKIGKWSREDRDAKTLCNGEIFL